MNRFPIVFLQVVIVVIGIGALAFLLGEPHLEGRNINATPFEIYFKDPFLAYAYIASIPFFVALYQAFQVLTYVRRDANFSPATLNALRTIRYCALAILGFVAGSIVFMPFGDPDDRPQGIVLRVLLAVGSVVVASAAAVFERILHNAVDLQSEHDLTL